MGNSDDFAWPPPESEIDRFEIVDLERGVTHGPPRNPDTSAPRRSRAEPAPTIVPRGPAARQTAPDFTWPPADDPREAIVPLDVTLDAGSPWAPAGEPGSPGEAETLVLHARRVLRAPGEWKRWAAAILLCVAGGALLERQVQVGLERLADADRPSSAGAAGRVDSRRHEQGRAAARAGGDVREGTFADVRLPRGLGDVGISRPMPASDAGPALMRTGTGAARTPPPALPAAAPPPTLVGSAASLAASPLALDAAPRVSIAPPAIDTRPTPDEAGIEATLDRYRTAYASLDAAAARSVWPSVDARALERAFGSLKSQGLDFDGCTTDVQGPEATSTCRGRTTYVPRIGSQRPRTEEHQWRFKLRKIDESWMIVSADAS